MAPKSIINNGGMTFAQALLALAEAAETHNVENLEVSIQIWALHFAPAIEPELDLEEETQEILEADLDSATSPPRRAFFYLYEGKTGRAGTKVWDEPLTRQGTTALGQLLWFGEITDDVVLYDANMEQLFKFVVARLNAGDRGQRLRFAEM